MSVRKYPQYQLRMPKSLKEWLRKEACKNHRSLNSEILVRLETTRKAEEHREETQ